MMTFARCLGLFALFFTFSLPLSGAAEPDATVRARFDANLKKLSQPDGFKCKFDQRIIYADGGSQTYSGQIDVRRPGMFRWQYEKPYVQLYAGDGQVIWHYEPDLMQAERLKNLEAVDPVVMQILDGRVKPQDVALEQYWHDSVLNVNRYQMHVGDSPTLWMGLNMDGTLAYVESKDQLDNINRVTLNHCSFIAPEVKHFSFVPPDGVDVLDIGQNR